MRNENREGPAPEVRKRGRPARWADAGARLRHHRAQVAEQRRLMQELIAAARDARWSDGLHQRLQFGDDTEVLRTLIEHYRSRHWERNRVPGPEEGGPSQRE